MKLTNTIALTLFIASTLGIEAAEQQAEKTRANCLGGPKPMRLNARHIEPGGIGYGLGYTTVEGFFPLYNGWENWVVFLDGRGHVFNDGRPAANAGLGVRYLRDTRVWGVNSYWDYRNTHRQHYNQVAAGLESLGRIWDFRLNGYLPVGEKKSHNYRTRFDEFKGHHAILRQKFEFVLAGANAEVGAHVNTWRHVPLYFAAGPYYLTGKGKTTWGGEARACINIYDYLKLEGYTSYDHLFKWTCQGQVSLGFSFGPRKKVKNTNGSCSDAIAVAKRAYQPVDRFEIIPVSRKHRRTTAINPKTGDPYYFWFVDNTSHSNGTFESPDNTLTSVNADVIYVFPGDGTTNGMNSGITLQNNQRLWGSGFAQTLPTTVGTVIVPVMSSRGAMDNTAVLPIIMNLNSGANVITLGNNNEISGLFIENDSISNAIGGTNITNARLLNCSLGGALGEGIIGLFATDLGGKLKIDNCVFAETIGVVLVNNTSNLKVKISDSNFNSATESIDWTLNNTSKGRLKIKESQFDSAGDGIVVSSFDTSSISAKIKESTITINGVGIRMDASAATNATQNLILKNSIIDSNSQAILVAQEGQLNINLVDNTIVAINGSENPAGACLEVDTFSGNASIAVTNNSMTGFHNFAILFNQNAGNLAATFENNTIECPDSNVIQSNVATLAVSHVLDMTENTLIGSQDWNFDQQVGSVSSTWKNNTVTGQGVAITWVSENAAIQTNLIFEDNNITADSGMSGVQLMGNLNLSLTGNELIASTSALALNLINSGTALNMSKNTTYGGISLLIVHQSGPLSASITDNAFSSVGNSNYQYDAIGTFDTSQQISGNAFTCASGASSVFNIGVLWDSPGTMDWTITNNTFQSAASFSFNDDVIAGTQVLNLSDNTLLNTGGYQLNAFDSSSVTWFVNDNDFIVNGNVPTNPFVVANANDSSNVCMELNDNTAYPTVGAYMLQNLGTGTFTLNPPQDNIGQISTTNVSIGTCP